MVKVVNVRLNDAARKNLETVRQYMLECFGAGVEVTNGNVMRLALALAVDAIQGNKVAVPNEEEG